MAFNKVIPGQRDFRDYVYRLRWYLLAIVITFVAFAAIGYLVGLLDPSFTQQIISGFKNDVGPLRQVSPLDLMMGIFANNVIKCFMVVVLGLGAGVAPLLFIVANGLMIGDVVGYSVGRGGLLYVLVGMLPHGVVEMPMVFLSGAIGLKLGTDILRSLGRAVLDAVRGPGSDAGRKKIELLKDIREALLIFAFWVAPLLLVAAFLETFVTGTLLYVLFAH